MAWRHIKMVCIHIIMVCWHLHIVCWYLNIVVNADSRWTAGDSLCAIGAYTVSFSIWERYKRQWHIYPGQIETSPIPRMASWPPSSLLPYESVMSHVLCSDDRRNCHHQSTGDSRDSYGRSEECDHSRYRRGLYLREGYKRQWRLYPFPRWGKSPVNTLKWSVDTSRWLWIQGVNRRS